MDVLVVTKLQHLSKLRSSLWSQMTQEHMPGEEELVAVLESSRLKHHSCSTAGPVLVSLRVTASVSTLPNEEKEFCPTLDPHPS